MDAISIAAVGMENDLQRLNSISQNLANVSTPGYKRQISVARAFESLMGTEGVQAAGTRGLNSSADAGVAIDHAVGTLRRTGNPLQLAVEGEGFFEVATERGSAYLRQATLRVDPSGRLLTEQGHALLGIGGEMRANGSAISIDGRGEIKQGETVVGQIKLVRFEDPKALINLGGGLFGPGQARVTDKGSVGQIRAGYQENSNVNSAQEMVRLSETVRHFESMQKIMQGYDDVFEKTIRKLGEF
ncbi:MAG: flagellar hook basal-body protein [Burkholderiales bacterium]|nr:flagellar hook basal-body protein [Burkholderiales bacterium]